MEQNRPPNHLETVTSTGTSVATRIPNAVTARNIFNGLFRSQARLVLDRAKIQKQLDGHAPDRHADLERLGLDWQSNVNFREMASSIRKHRSSIWRLFTGGQSIASLTYKGTERSGTTTVHWEEVVEEEFSKLLREDWDGFHYEVQQWITQMLNFGPGIAIYEDEHTWMFESIPSSSLLVPAKAKADVTKLDVACLVVERDALWLLDRLKDPEVARVAGWNETECRRILKNKYFSGVTNGTIATLPSCQEMLEVFRTNGEAASVVEANPLVLVYCLSRESDGRITHQIILKEEDLVNGKPQEEVFLFEKVGRFESMSSVLSLLLFEIGDGRLRGQRGLGHELYAMTDISNRMINGTANAALISSGLILKQTSGYDDDSVPVTKIGSLVLIAPNVETVSKNFAPPLESLVVTRRMIQNVLNSNVGQYESRYEGTRDRSASEVNIEARREARFDSDQSSWYLLHWEKLIRQVFSRLIVSKYEGIGQSKELRERFVSRCQKRNVPVTELLNPDNWEVHARKSIGLGNEFLTREKTGELMEMLPLLQESAQRRAIDERLATIVGWEEVKKFSPLTSADRMPGVQHHIAEMEGHDLAQGIECTVHGDDMHIEHLTRHLQSFVRMLELLAEQGAEGVVQAYAAGGAYLQHMAQHHAAAKASTILSGKAKAFEQPLAVARDRYRAIEQQYKQLQQQQAQAEAQRAAQMKQLQEQASMVELEKERIKVAGKVQVQMEEARLLGQARFMKTINQIQARQAELEAAIQRKDLEAASSIMRENQRASAEIAMQMATAQQGG